MALIPRGRIGLSNVYVAVLDETTDTTGGNPSWGTPIAISGSAELLLDTAASLTTYFGDNSALVVGETVGDMKVSAKFYDVIPSTMQSILGMTYANGQLVLASTASSPYLAIMGKILMEGQNSGNSVSEYFVAYKIMLGKPKKDIKTKGSSVNFQEVQFDGKMVAMISNQNIMMTQRDDDTLGSSTALSNWFTSVQLPGANNNALSVVATQGGSGSSSTVVLTFAKAGGASFRINFATITALSCRITKAGVLQGGTFVDTTGAAGTTQVVTFTPTVAWAASQKIGVNVDSTAKDTSNIGCTYYTTELTLS